MSKLYQAWLKLREHSKNNDDEPGRGLCYCGHTQHCECADPGKVLFNESVQYGSLDLSDPNNKWKNMKE